MKFYGEFIRILFFVSITMRNTEAVKFQFQQYDFGRIVDKQVLRLSRKLLADAEFKFLSSINVTIIQNSTDSDCCIKMVLLGDNDYCSCIDSCGAVPKLGCTNQFHNETLHIVTEFQNCSHFDDLVSIFKTSTSNEQDLDSCQQVNAENITRTSTTTHQLPSSTLNPKTSFQTSINTVTMQPTTPFGLPGLGMFTVSGGGKSSHPIKTNITIPSASPNHGILAIIGGGKSSHSIKSTPTMPSKITLNGNTALTSTVHGLPGLTSSDDNSTTDTAYVALSTKSSDLGGGGNSSHPIKTTVTTKSSDLDSGDDGNSSHPIKTTVTMTSIVTETPSTTESASVTSLPNDNFTFTTDLSNISTTNDGVVTVQTKCKKNGVCTSGLDHGGNIAVTVRNITKVTNSEQSTPPASAKGGLRLNSFMYLINLSIVIVLFTNVV